MNSNTHSTSTAAGLTALAAAVDGLATQDLDRLADAALAERVLELRRLLNRLEGYWLRTLAAVDGRGAAGADQGQPAPSTAGWLRARLRLGAAAAAGWVRTARALYCGPLTQTGHALTDGDLSAAHAQVLAAGTHDLPAPTAAEAEPVLLAAARRLDPPRLRRVVTHLRWVADPEVAEGRAERQQQQRGLWLSPTLEGMVALQGLLEPEAGQTLLAALEPLTRPGNAEDTRSGSQRRADGLAELARRALEGGQLPQMGGVRPQLTVTVDLDSLLGRNPGLGGEVGGPGPLGPEACRRLACDGAVTRVLVTRHHPGHGSNHHPGHGGGDGPGGEGSDDPGGEGSLAERLQAAVALLPPVLGGAPTQPLEVGRASRVVQPAQRVALAIRDGGCVFPGCDRPLGWCEAHHLRHWLHGGPTDLGNLALLCRAHHRAIHEGGWRLARQPDGQVAATPPHRRHPAAA
jgi:Domain of unknown function (DUF222)/HNH endonuclease